MDEIAKVESRNYLCAAGFFLIAAVWLLDFIVRVSGKQSIESTHFILIIVGIGLILVATLLLILRKRDIEAILFIAVGSYLMLIANAETNEWRLIITGGMLVLSLLSLTTKDKKQWFFFLIPALVFLNGVIDIFYSSQTFVSAEYSLFIIVISLYFAICYVFHHFNLPGRDLLLSEEYTNFEKCGCVIPNILFSMICGAYVVFYIVGASVLPLEAFVNVQVISAFLFMYYSILLLFIGKQRLTSLVYFLFGLTGILSMFCSGIMFYGIGILFIVLGLFAILRKGTGILLGIMTLVYASSWFISTLLGNTVAPVLSILLNLIPCLISLYLGLAAYSRWKLPRI